MHIIFFRFLFHTTGKTNIHIISGDERTISDGFGGVIIRLTEEFFNDSFPLMTDSSNIYLQRVANNGEILWKSGGIKCNSDIVRTMCPDMEGGVIVVEIYISESIEYEYYLHRINYLGESIWNINFPNENIVKVVSDRSGGTYYLYYRYNGEQEVQYYCSHINNSSGQKTWSESKKIGPVVWGETDLDIDIYPYTVDDGVVLVCNIGTVYEPETFNIYAQKIHYNGSVLWGDSLGIAVCDTINDQSPYKYSTCHDNDGGVFVAWNDLRHKVDGYSAIYMQHILNDGTNAWSNQGELISYKNINYHNQLVIISDSNNCSILCWNEYDGEGERGVFAQQVDADGKLGQVTSRLIQKHKVV